MQSHLVLNSWVKDEGRYGIAIGDNAYVGLDNNVTKKNNDDVTSGVAIGRRTKVMNKHATAIGAFAQATGEQSIALGGSSSATYAAKASNVASIALGEATKSEGVRSVAIAKESNATATDSIAMGTKSKATDVNAIAIGTNSEAIGQNSIAIGVGNRVSGTHSGAYGDPSEVLGNNSYTFGNDNIVNTATSDAFILGNQNGMGTLGQYDSNGKLTLGSGTGTTNASNSASVGNRNYISTEDTFVLGSGINTKGTGRSLTSIGSTVANSVYLGKDSSDKW